jgi:hypothetical protein
VIIHRLIVPEQRISGYATSQLKRGVNLSQLCTDEVCRIPQLIRYYASGDRRERWSAFLAQDFDPFAESQVGGDDSRAPLMTLRQQVAEQFATPRPVRL